MTDMHLTFEGQHLPARHGQSLAAALTEAGHRTFRSTPNADHRGIFCGMGVCQDCLLTVDGTPNVRACMTAASDGMVLARQGPHPEFTGQVTAAADTLHLSPDVLVIGGGAGGLSAALSAARAGASVVVLDERKVGGGQYYKQSAAGAILDTQQQEGADLLAETLGSGAQILGEVEIWGVFEPLLILAHQRGGPLVARPKTVIVATGAYERPVMVPGWTLPGVMTTGAAQTLWRSYGTLPGKRVAVCGSGPLNLQVALELAEGGAETVRLAESAPHPITRPAAAISMLVAAPTLALKGISMEVRLRKAGVTMRNNCSLIRVAQDGEALAATFQGPDTSQETVTVDALCMNAGFEPQNEILRLFGAGMEYDPAMGHLRCQTDATMQTRVDGLYAVGDCKGLGGAPAARAEGAIAGAHAAKAAGHGDAYDLFAADRALRHHRRFQSRLWRLYDTAPAPVDLPPDETTLCRCEELSFGDIRTGMGDDPRHAGALKRATRLGMGRCQGRYCGPVAARMVADATGKTIQDLSFFAPRVPIKPVAISTLLAAESGLDDED